LLLISRSTALSAGRDHSSATILDRISHSMEASATVSRKYDEDCNIRIKGTKTRRVVQCCWCCADDYILHTTYYILHTTYYLLPTTYYTLHTAHCTRHTANYILHPTYCTLHTAHCILHTTYYILHTTIPTAYSCILYITDDTTNTKPPPTATHYNSTRKRISLTWLCW
jgi:hypothetical protein